jgi:hypothetical protein
VKLRRLAMVVLLLFIAGYISTSAGEVIHSMANEAHASEAKGSSCPDPGNDGAPCGPECPCTCCPGHRLAVAFPISGPSIVAPSSDDLDPALPADLHPKEIGKNIFRPPRV